MPAVPPLRDQRRAAVRSLLPNICPSNKMGFVTAERALAHAERTARKYRQAFDVYRCPKCGGYHLTKATEDADG